jgi:hypothetical protein
MKPMATIFIFFVGKATSSGVSLGTGANIVIAMTKFPIMISATFHLKFRRAYILWFVDFSNPILGW